MEVGLNGGGIVINGGAIGNCDCCCAYPLMDVTLSWTDADTEKTYLGETFTNGQTHEVCPKRYVCKNYTTGTNPIDIKREGWYWTDSGISKVTHGDRRRIRRADSIYPNAYTNTTTGSILNFDYQKLYLYWGKVIATMTTGTSLDKSYSQIIHMNIGPTTANTNTAEAYLNTRHSLEYTGRKSNAVSGFTHQTGTPPYLQNKLKTGITDDYNSTYTTALGVTVTWARNTTGATWGECF